MDEIDANEKRRRFLEKKRFYFQLPLDSGNLDSQPPRRRQQLRAIKDLKRQEFADYVASIDNDPKVTPWRQDRPWRAAYIRDLASDLRACGDSEYSWRVRLEQEVLRPFTVESACDACGGRFWAPELRTRHQRDSEKPEYEEARQLACKCDNHNRRRYMLNRLFQDKMDETTRYPAEAQSLMKKGERPDRIYGLRQTDELRRALYDLEDLTITPFKKVQKFIIFPFLVLEAKSAKNGDTFDDVDLQSSLAIMEVLRIQWELFQKAGRSDPQTFQGPFAWYIGYKGHEWKLHAAFADTVEGDPEYNVYPTWSGDLTSRDDALQLTLIIDHIVDWARTEYRKEVLDSLGNILASPVRELALRDTQERFRETPQDLATNGSRSVTNGRDGTDTPEIIKQESEREVISTEVEEYSASSSANNSEEMTSYPVLFQDGSLLIQRATVTTQIVRRFVSDIDVQAVVDSWRDSGERTEVWNCLYFTIKLTMKELRYVEQQWLGYEPTPENNLKHSDSQQLLLLFTIQFLLEPEPKLCLSYYAFPSDFKDSIRSLYPQLLGDDTVPWRDMNVSQLTDLFTSIRQCSVRFMIRACISNNRCILHPILFPKLRNNPYYNTQTRIDDHILMNRLGYSWSRIDTLASKFGKETYGYDEGHDLQKHIPLGEALNQASSTPDAVFGHDRWFTEPPSARNGPVLFNDPKSFVDKVLLFLFSEAIYEDDFRFETSISIPSRLWEHHKGSLKKLRAQFSGLSDAEICKALVDSPGYPDE